MAEAAARIRGRAGRLAGRAGWALLDQGISSFTNFALGILIARSVSADEFGAFSLAFATYVVIVNLARAIGTQPLVIRYSGVDPADWRRGAGAAMGTMLATGIVIGLLCVVGGLLAGGAAGIAFVALGIALPALLVQDGWRFVFFAGGRDRDAVITDFVWAVALIALLVVATRIAPGSPGAILGWGVSAVIGGIVGAWRAGVVPRVGSTRAWLHEHNDLVGRFSAEVLIGLGANQATIYVVGLTAGLAQAGSLRAAQILLGPMHVVLQAAHLIAVPEGVRIRLRRPQRFRLAIGGLSVGLASVIGLWVLVLALLPVNVGQALLGDSWAEAQVVLIPLGLALIAQGISGGALVGLRVLADAKSSLRARIIDSVSSFILGVGGALLGGAVGAAWGVAAGEWVSAVIFVAFFLRSERLHRGIVNP
jgi:O-antigen/teichoic acid export membrane protein